MTETVGCWNPPCIESKARGGPGCYMCDVMPIKFPQPAKKAKVFDDDGERGKPRKRPK